ncbi:MFS transporter [Deinococcus cellulosilyticus]|uniref:MFS transporter n=1 Tax=Deinococcus cellulosilyticus (strain DSM 18568 / NBRC 106333 / KACC 11606 / 5516J-15) TaxID=1223518 RepID=A0A511MZV3_DEIC1|nr:MFS transporter [Deinococcus cellulosilyticus]GEM45646.1 MFS transporter [Deinococcus cellulosilyticus NBRC 106333 = KACC 11606]
MLKPFYGWTLARVLAITCTLSYGILYYTFSVFTLPMEEELGWTRAQTSLGFSLALIVSGLLGPMFGKHVDHKGARGVMALGSLLGSATVLLWANVHTLWQYYAVWTLMGVAWAAVFYDVAFTVINHWFRQLRSRALLLITLTAGLASTIFIPLSTWLLAHFSWRDALLVLAGLLAVGTILPHLIFLRGFPREMGQTVDGLPETVAPPHSAPAAKPTAVLKTAVFWWLTVSFMFGAANSIALAAHMVPMLSERGYSPALIATSAALVGFMSLPGRAIFTPLSERVSSLTLTVVTLSAQALAFLGLLILPGQVGLWLFVALFGLSNGALTLARASLIADTFGSTHYGFISGAMNLWASMAKAIFPVLIGFLYLRFQGYGPVLLGLSVLSLLSIFAVWQAGRSHLKLKNAPMQNT